MSASGLQNRTSVGNRAAVEPSKEIAVAPKAARGAATRLHIVDVATRLFAAQGYEATPIEAVLAACGLSKGAVYHHFRNKEALFAACLEAVEERIVGAVAGAASGAANPLEALRAGCAAWLGLVVNDEAVQRIAVVDAPAVLGWHAWRSMESRYALGLLKRALAAAAEMGRFDGSRVEAYASMLLAVLNEMAMLIALADDRAATAEAANDAVEQLISGLLGVAPGAPWPAVRSPGGQ